MRELTAHARCRDVARAERRAVARRGDLAPADPSGEVGVAVLERAGRNGGRERALETERVESGGPRRERQRRTGEPQGRSGHAERAFDADARIAPIRVLLARVEGA